MPRKKTPKTESKVIESKEKQNTVASEHSSPGAEIDPAHLSAVARLLDGLTILERHGAIDVYSQTPEICVAGPNLTEALPEADQKLLEDLGWMWYDTDGWVFETL